MLTHHLPRNRIDRRFSYRNRKTSPGYGADTLSCMESNSSIRRQFNLGEDSCQVSDVRIVSGIFDCTRNCPMAI